MESKATTTTQVAIVFYILKTKIYVICFLLMFLCYGFFNRIKNWNASFAHSDFLFFISILIFLLLFICCCLVISITKLTNELKLEYLIQTHTHMIQIARIIANGSNNVQFPPKSVFFLLLFIFVE